MPVDIWFWILFLGVIGGLLTLDLLVFHRHAHVVTMREAAVWTAVWVSLGLGFGALVFAWRGVTAGTEYLAGYFIEYSLSMDNVFVFAMLFTYFAVPAAYQHRVLFWGVVGAIVLRGIFIAGGAVLIEAFHATLYVFGAILVVTGVRMALARGHAMDPERNVILRLVRRFVPLTDGYRGQSFFVREAGRRLATPLFAVLVVVEATDVVFAIDSVPAIFAITTDPFIVYTSNAFAILGLRSLYFLLAGLIHRFVYLKLALGALLVFAGTKMLLSDIVKIPAVAALGVIVTILAVGVIASLLATREGDDGSPEQVPPLPAE